MPDPSMPLAIQIIVLIIITMFNAFFASANTAIEYCSKNKIKTLAQEGSKNAELLLKTIEDPTKSISALHIASTFLCLLLACFAAGYMADDLEILLAGFAAPYTYEVALLLLIFILSFIILVIGDDYPRKIAIQHAESVGLVLIRPLNLVTALLKPFVYISSISVKLLLKITRQNPEPEEEEFSEDEVMSMLEVGQETGVLKEEGKKMITSIFEFDDKLAYEIMTPRTDVFLIDVDDPPEEYLEELMELRYSRIPVYQDDTDNIIGILNIKDYFLHARTEGFENVDIKSILRKPYFVPETKNIDSLFITLQSTKNHIAILIDEYGGFSGIVTMEDIIEEVMGDIDDEYDEQELEIEKLEDNVYLIDGFANLHDINDKLNLSLDSDNSETIGGMLMDILGEIPDDNEHIDQDITMDKYIFRILSIKERRIEKVRLTIVDECESQMEETNG